MKLSTILTGLLATSATAWRFSVYDQDTCESVPGNARYVSAAAHQGLSIELLLTLLPPSTSSKAKDHSLVLPGTDRPGMLMSQTADIISMGEDRVLLGVMGGIKASRQKQLSCLKGAATSITMAFLVSRWAGACATDARRLMTHTSTPLPARTKQIDSGRGAWLT
jgi:hypothetical protein